MLKFLLRPVHASWSFYALVWGIIIGIILSLVFEQAINWGITFVICSVFIAILCLRQSCRLTLVVVLLLGILLGSCRVSSQLSGREIIATYYSQEVLLSGVLSEDPDTSKSPMVVRLKNLRIYSADAEILPHISEMDNYTAIAGNMYVTLAGQPELERSDMVLLRGKLGEGFGTFTAKMSRPKLLAMERKEPGDIFAQIKYWFADMVRQFIPSPEVDLGLGYLMGMKTGLSEDFAEALRAVGMTHVVVASGAHLAILTGVAKKIFGKISKFAGLLCSLLMIGGFVMIVGFTPSMTRAALVASLSLLVGYVGRKFTPIRLISFVAMLTLLIDPNNFLNLGWQLSFASFFGILVMAPRLQKLFYGGKQPPWLAGMLITSLATSLVCAPVLIYNFGSLSLLAFVANLIVLPTLPYAMLLMMATGVCSFWPWLAGIIAMPTTWLLDLHIWVVNFLSEKTMFILEFPVADMRIYLWYILLIILLLAPVGWRKYRLKRQAQPKPLAPEVVVAKAEDALPLAKNE